MSPAPEKRPIIELHGEEGSLEDYKPDAAGNLPFVVVNIKGKWQQVRLQEQPKMEKGNIIATVVDIANNPQKVTLDYWPDVVAFHLNDTIDQALVTGMHIRKDGRIEFDVTEAGQESRGIPQELLKAWKKTVELEDTVTSKEQEIEGLIDTKRDDLYRQHAELRKRLEEAKVALPSLSEMQDIGKKTLSKKEKELEKIHKKAEEILEKLEEEIKTAKPEEAWDADKKFDEFEPTEAEKKERKAIAAKLEKEIQGRVRRELEELEEWKQEIIDQQVEQAENDYNTAVATFEQNVRDPAKWDAMAMNANNKFDQALAKVNRASAIKPYKKYGAKLKGKGTYAQPPDALLPFDKTTAFQKVKNLSRKDRQEYTKRKKGADLQANSNAVARLKNAKDPYVKQLFVALNKRRKEDAKTHLGKDVKTGDFDTTGGDQSPRNRKNKEILDELLTEWKGDKAPDVDPHADVFNYEQEVENTIQQINELLDKIPKGPDGKTPKPLFAIAFDDLKALKVNIREDEKNLSTPAAIQKADKAGTQVGGARPGHAPVTTFLTGVPADFKGTKFDFVRKRSIDIAHEYLAPLRDIIQEGIEIKTKDELTKEVEAHKLAAETDKAKKEAAKAGTYEGDRLEIRAEHIRMVLESKQAEVKALMQGLYENIDLAAQKQDRVPDVVKQKFEALFSTFDLATLQPAEQRKWQDAGVKDSEKFKELWKKKLAEQVAKSFMESARHTLETKVAKKMQEGKTALKKAGKLKKQLLFRAGLTIAFVGGAASGGALLVGAAGYATLAAIAGGAAGGAARGKINQWMSGIYKEGQEKALEELHKEAKQEVINEIVAERFEPGTFTAHVEGLSQVSTMMAAVLRKFEADSGELLGGPDSAEVTRLLNQGSFDEVFSKSSDSASCTIPSICFISCMSM